MIISSLFLLVLSFTFAQNQNKQIAADPRVTEVFGQETVNFYLENKPSIIQYYNFFLENSYTISEIPQEKISDLKDIAELKLKPSYQMEFVDYTDKGLENLNIMKFDLNIDPNIGPIYRLGNTNKLIFFLSGKEIQSLYNQFLMESK